MKTISRITTAKKNKHRYHIYLAENDHESYGFTVDQDILIKYQLRKGLELNEEMIATLMQKDTINKFYQLAIYFLSYRMRSKKEVHDYLVKKEVDSSHIDVIIEKLIQEGLLNDYEFADAFIQTRIHTSSKGPLLIKNELLEKGISKHIVEEVIGNYDDTVQYEKALKYANKKFQSGRRRSFQMELQHVQSALVRRGFTQEIIQDVLAALRLQKDGGAEWEALVYQGEKLWRKYGKKYEGFTLQNKVKSGLFRKGFSPNLITNFIEDRNE